MKKHLLNLTRGAVTPILTFFAMLAVSALIVLAREPKAEPPSLALPTLPPLAVERFQRGETIYILDSHGVVVGACVASSGPTETACGDSK